MPNAEAMGTILGRSLCAHHVPRGRIVGGGLWPLRRCHLEALAYGTELVARECALPRATGQRCVLGLGLLGRAACSGWPRHMELEPQRWAGGKTVEGEGRIEAT